MNEVHARLRRLGARWLFVDQRMSLVAEEIGVGDFGAPGRVQAREERYAGLVGSRNADVIGLRRPENDARRLALPLQPGGLWRDEPASVVVGAETRIIEVKASRSDFIFGLRKGQISNDFRGLGYIADYCYVLIPWGLAKPDEMPPGWGLMWWWEGPQDYVEWCTTDHGLQPAWHNDQSATVKPGEASRWIDLFQPRAMHVRVRTIEGPTLVRHRRGLGDGDNIFRAKGARRLSPVQPLTAKLDRLENTMVQSILWRHYGKPAPDDVDVSEPAAGEAV